jgi:NADPH:quinone reductase-like Zn-dependent oxidoreductase
MSAQLMKAALCRRYGPPDVIEIGDVPRPKVRSKDVLIKVRATTVTAGDWRLRSGNVPPGFGLFIRVAVGFTGPRDPILGGEIAGDVVAVGPAVTRFRPGDKVFAGRMGGCHAEYVAMQEDNVAPMPANRSYAEAAALTFGGLTAITFLRDKANVQPGERVLINGASGAVGCAAVQLAKYLKADVTAVCSAVNAELVTSLGADRVIDYAREDFARGGARYDVIFDAVGNCSFERCKEALRPGGRLLLAVGSLGEMIGSMIRPSRAGRKVFSGVASISPANLDLLRRLSESGEFKTVIDRTYPFARIADAHALVDTGRKKGNVIVTLEEPRAPLAPASGPAPRA